MIIFPPTTIMIACASLIFQILSLLGPNLFKIKKISMCATTAKESDSIK